MNIVKLFKHVSMPALRALSVLLAALFAVSALMTGSLALANFRQTALNEARGSQGDFPVRLIKLDKDTEQPIEGAEFYLYTEDDEQINGRYLTDADGKISINLAPGGYYFEETNPGQNYTYDLDEHNTEIKRYPFEVTGEDKAVFIITAYNRRVTGDLIIKKTVKNADDSDLTPTQLATEFEFTVEFGDGTSDTFTLKHGDKKVYDGLPAGLTYIVTEAPAPDYTTTSTGHQGEITAQGKTASFTNTARLGSLTISKIVTGKTPDPDEKFEFTVTIGDNINETIYLAHGESKTYDNLPIGTPYTMSESDYTAQGYITTPSARGYSGNVTGDHALPFVNIYDDGTDEPGSLLIKKTVAGDSTDQEFTFTVTIGDETETITLRHGESKLYDDIPAGTPFTVEEVRDDDYRTSISIAGITINSNHLSAVIAPNYIYEIEFINTKIDVQDVNLAMKKTVTGNVPAGADTLEFAFILEVEGRPDVPFTLKHGQPKSFTVPEGVPYTIREVNIPAGWSLTDVQNGSGTTADGIIAEFKNKYDIPIIINIDGEKTWVCPDGTALPTQITLRLKNGSIVVAVKTVTPDENGKWAYTFTGIPQYDVQGNEIAYTIEEIPVNGWKASYDGFDVTNTYIPPAVLENILVEKTISGGTPAQAAQFRFLLTALDGAPMPTGSTITIAGADEAAFGSITYHAPGAYVYTITEISTGDEDYTYDESVYTLTIIVEERDGALLIVLKTLTKNGNAVQKAIFTNDYHPDVTKVRVTKQWAGDTTTDRPGSVKVQLYKDGAAHGGFEVLNNGNGWTHLWTGLEKGPTWTVDELEVPAGYTKSIFGDAVNGYTIMNTWGAPPETTSVHVRKIWHGEDANRPAGVTVQLYKNGTAHGNSITLNASNGWEYTWTGLEKGPTWTVDELNIPAGYTKTVMLTDTGFVVTNTKGYTPPGQITISGKKTWEHGSNPVRGWPISIVLHIKADGEIVRQKLITEAEHWSWSVRVDEFAPDGHKIVYTVDEASVQGYRKAVDGFNITNTYIPGEEPPGTTSVTVRKEWAGMDTPPSGGILAQLYRDGVPYSDCVKLNAGNQWRHTWKSLPAGTWTVDEFDVPEGYVKSIAGSAAEGFVITNTREPRDPGRTLITGGKTWVHGANPPDKRPKSIALRVSANGVFILQMRVSEADHWNWDIHMDKFDKDGKVIKYTVDEAPIENYVQKVNGFNITNTYTPGANKPGGPGRSGGPGKPGGPSNPKTDDENNLALWLTLMGFSLAGLVLLIILAVRRKRREEEIMRRGLW